MRENLRRAGCVVLALVVWGAWLVGPVRVLAAEVAGMVTELRVDRGRVEVKPAGAQEWRKAGPLLALRAGDTVRVTEEASAVILLSGGRGSFKVSRTNSPFVVPAIQEEGKTQKALTLLDASLGFLSTSAKEAPRATLSTRGVSKPPVVLTPRNGPVLPDSLTFEWLGSRFVRYTVRIAGPGGVVLERKELTGASFHFPADAPPLTPGVRYTLEVGSASHPAQQAWFEVLDASRAQAIQRDMTALEQAAGPTVSPNTLVTLRTGLLASNDLIHDARRSLIAGLTNDPDEPTFYLLLGTLYEKLGLPEQAAEAFDEANFLLTVSAKR